MTAVLRTSRLDHLRLAWDLARRDLSAKYRRSVIGPLWLLLTPLCLLGIYWLVFGVIFGVEWRAPHAAGEQGVGFLLPFFAGLVVYLAFSDVVSSSSVLFTSKRTYVVKSPFPIWVLWLANLLRAGVHAAVGLALVLALALLQKRLTGTGLALLLAALALCILFLGAVSLLLACFGAFAGDVSDAMRLLLRVLFYATPITYPLTLVPAALRDWMWLNPLTPMVELVRGAVVFGTLPPWQAVAGFAVAVSLLGAVAAWVYRRLHGVIPDVV